MAGCSDRGGTGNDHYFHGKEGCADGAKPPREALASREHSDEPGERERIQGDGGPEFQRLSPEWRSQCFSRIEDEPDRGNDAEHNHGDGEPEQWLVQHYRKPLFASGLPVAPHGRRSLCASSKGCKKCITKHGPHCNSLRFGGET